jgi:uncharacterized protein (TIGR02271 family)
LNKEKFYLPKSISHGFNGHTLLFDITEEDAKEKFMNEPAQVMETQSTTTTTAAQDMNVEKPIPVIEEKLEVSKKETIQEAKIIKKPKIEFKTVEVELTYEELIIEKRPVEGNISASSSTVEMAQSKTEISIPLKREDVIVSKKPYVKEEILIKKVPVSETKRISEKLISEKISIRNPAGEEIKEEKNE